jgi:MobA/VirD2-like, nuclease domain
MPPRILDRDDDLRLDLRQGPRSDERGKWIQRAQQAHRLPKPLNQLGARGVWVPTPPANSQGAVVKLWTAKASTTREHAGYLSKGKGLAGADAELYDRDGTALDRPAFIQRARQDDHQIRAMVSLDAGHRADLVEFARRLMRQMEADIQSPVDALFAVHHDTPRPHVHFVIRGVLPNGDTLYLTKSYWASGVKYRAQGIATAMLGPVRQPVSVQLSAALAQLRARLQGKEMTHG